MTVTDSSDVVEKEESRFFVWKSRRAELYNKDKNNRGFRRSYKITNAWTIASEARSYIMWWG